MESLAQRAAHAAWLRPPRPLIPRGEALPRTPGGVSVGVDIVDVRRVRRCVASDAFCRRTFTNLERSQARRAADPELVLAELFAAKEAIFKSLRLPSRALDNWTSIEIVDIDSAHPRVRLGGALQALDAVSAITLGVRRDSPQLISYYALCERTEPNEMTAAIPPALADRARKTPRRIVLPEATDAAVITAARHAVDEGVARPILLGDPALIRAAAGEAGGDLPGVEILDIGTLAEDATLAEKYQALHPEHSTKGILRNLKKPLTAAAILLALGEADAMVAGVAHTTEEVILAGLKFVGLQDGVRNPSSIFLMRVPGFRGPEGDLMVFADCGVVVNPDAEALADIALMSARTTQAILGWEPKVAMLSYSTKGSSEDPSIDRVRESLALVSERSPELKIDGELQLDAAIIPAVAARKVPQVSPVAGSANVLIFPDLNAGNIAYKAVQRFAGGEAFGPFLQGFARTLSDLSRGSSADDILGVMTMASIHAAHARP